MKWLNLADKYQKLNIVLSSIINYLKKEMIRYKSRVFYYKFRIMKLRN